MMKWNIGVFCDSFGAALVICLIKFFAMTTHETLEPKMLFASWVVVSLSLLLCRHGTRLWAITRESAAWFNTPWYGLVSGSRYATLTSVNKGGSYYAIVEALDGPTKGVVRVINFGADNPPREFVFHQKKAVIALQATGA